MGGFAVGRAKAQDFADTRPVTFDAPPVPFWSSVAAGFDDQTQTRNFGVREEGWRQALYDRHRQIEAASGAMTLPDEWFTQDPSGEAQGAAAFADSLNERDYEAEVEKRRAANPGAFANIPTRDQLRATWEAKLAAVRARADLANRDHPVGAFVGGAGGAIIDPPNVGAMVLTGPLGGGRTLAGRLLTSMATNTALQAALTPAQVADASFGGPKLTPGEVGGNVLAAGFGAGALHLGGEAIGAVARRVPGLAEIFAQAPETRAAVHVAEQAARDDVAIGPVDGLTHEEGLDALVRGRPKPAVEPAQELGDLFGETAPSAGVAPGITGETDYRGRTIYQGSFTPDELTTDAARFQYKEGADAGGVTARLKGVEAWDPTASGKVIVYEDRTGARYIADGHQRLGLARRLDAAGFDPRLDGYLFREADGWTARQVRTVAALKNIREGSGTILDAAKVFRDAPESLKDRSLPVTGDFISQARALAQLHPEAFGAVVNKVIPERYAAEIGAMAHNRPDLHVGLVRLLKEADPANLDEARSLVSEAMLDDWIKREGEQTDMFGGLAPESTVIARAKVKNAVLTALRKDARVYGQLVKHADAIEAGGNVLLRDANETAAVINRTALEVLSRLSLRSGDVGDAMAAAAKAVMEGQRPADAAKGLASMVRNRIAAGEQLDGLRIATLDPQPPTEGALDLAAKLDDPTSAEAQRLTAEAPEDKAVAETPGLFDDLADRRAEERAHDRLTACAPGE